MSNEKGSSSRRDFVRLMLGGFVAPSLIWPFRKYFLPPARPVPFPILWASTYWDQPGTGKVVNAADPVMYVDGPHPRKDSPYSFNYYFVGRDGNMTVASPLVNHDAWGQQLRSFRLS